MSAAGPVFRPEQFERYRRHLNLGELGVAGQQRLLEGRVLLVGAGGLGCPVAQYLAAAGVGHLGIVDDDVVDVSNLQRQILYGTADVGRPKAEVAAERIRALNPDVEVTLHQTRLTSENAEALLAGWDVVVDGSDNFPTRYLVNDACVLLGIPCVYGAILRFDGQAAVFDAKRGPCYRCLFPEPPPPGSVPSCAEGGVLGVLPGLIALVQATEALKLVAGIGEPLIGRFLQYDALELSFREFRFSKDPECPVCGEHPTLEALVDYEGFCGLGPRTAAVDEETAAQVAARGAPGEGFLLLDVRTPEEFEKAQIEGARLIPLAELPVRLDELDDWRDRPVVVQCHHGGRSEQACRILVGAGFGQIHNLSGGIEAWSLTVDPSIPRY